MTKILSHNAHPRNNFLSTDLEFHCSRCHAPLTHLAAVTVRLVTRLSGTGCSSHPSSSQSSSSSSSYSSSSNHRPAGHSPLRLFLPSILVPILLLVPAFVLVLHSTSITSGMHACSASHSCGSAATRRSKNRRGRTLLTPMSAYPKNRLRTARASMAFRRRVVSRRISSAWSCVAAEMRRPTHAAYVHHHGCWYVDTRVRVVAGSWRHDDQWHVARTDGCLSSRAASSTLPAMMVALGAQCVVSCNVLVFLRTQRLKNIFLPSPKVWIMWGADERGSPPHHNQLGGPSPKLAGDAGPS
jgi:hypothetical protein